MAAKAFFFKDSNDVWAYGTKYVTNTSVAAWSSKALMVDPNPAPSNNSSSKPIKSTATGKYLYNPATGKWYYKP